MIGNGTEISARECSCHLIPVRAQPTQIWSPVQVLERHLQADRIEELGVAAMAHSLHNYMKCDGQVSVTPKPTAGNTLAAHAANRMPPAAEPTTRGDSHVEYMVF